MRRETRTTLILAGVLALAVAGSRLFEGAAEPPSVSKVGRASLGFCHVGGGKNCVVDGDTFRLRGDRVRIVGIDAPETHGAKCAAEERLGRRATERLHGLLNSGSIELRRGDRDRDQNGRLLRHVAVDGRDVGALLIKEGLARSYKRSKKPWCPDLSTRSPAHLVDLLRATQATFG